MVGNPEGSDMNNELLIERIAGYLRNLEQRYIFYEETSMIEFDRAGTLAPFCVRITTGPDDDFVGVLVFLPLFVPETNRVEMADAINRANFGMMIGCFEMRMSDGLMSFRAGMPVADGDLTERQFRSLLVTAFQTADQYYRAFARLVFADDLSPAEVVAEVEMQEQV